jgi:hypothetical protein
MMIVISGTSSAGRTLFNGLWIIPDSSDCSARASSCSDRSPVNFGRKLKFARLWRPGGDRKQDCSNRKIDCVENNGCVNGA